MKTTVGIILTAMLSGLMAVGAAMRPEQAGDVPLRGPSPGAKPVAERFVVHEWGTFTNFSGAEGTLLDFRPNRDQELPDFVFDRGLQAQNGLCKFFRRSRQRMETPVTYFYTDRPRKVHVRIDFPEGLLTEFYPPAQAMGPELAFGEPPPLKNSFLDWGQLRIFPESHLANLVERDEEGNVVSRPAPPVVEGDNHYAYARDTDSAIVQTWDAGGGNHCEKFLFYRGVGNFSLPLAFSALGQGRFEVRNFGPDAVESLFLVHIQGGRARYSFHPRLEANGALYVEEAAADATVDQLGEDMVRALTATGLYEKEARSMVKTWHSSWFGEEGVRLLYLVPTRLTEELLPITIEPAPDELVRVLVGRMEIVTPEQAQQLSALLRELGTCISADVEPLRGELDRLGRFAEPALEHLLGQTTDPERVEQIRTLLAQVRGS